MKAIPLEIITIFPRPTFVKSMKLNIHLIILLFALGALLSKNANAQLKVKFPSKDELTITADWYPVSSNLPVILLCHQNGFSRGEFNETALRLNKFGFNCLAIDLRVGNEVNGVTNETAALAKKKNLNPTFEDTEQDINAAIDYLQTQYKQKVILLGSSYTASLALKIAVENPRISAVVAYSPGEYFSDKNFIKGSIEKLTKPVFVTSSKEESDKVTELLQDVNSRIKIQYIPKKDGEHGSKVLWVSSVSNQEYWIALMNFLDKIKNLQ